MFIISVRLRKYIHEKVSMVQDFQENVKMLELCDTWSGMEWTS